MAGKNILRIFQILEVINLAYFSRGEEVRSWFSAREDTITLAVA